MIRPLIHDTSFTKVEFLDEKMILNYILVVLSYIVDIRAYVAKTITDMNMKIMVSLFRYGRVSYQEVLPL